MRWDGARQPTIWMAPPPDIGPSEARLELARRYLHVFGPATPEASPPGPASRRGRVRRPSTSSASLMPVRTPIGNAWILASDEPLLRRPTGPAAPARLLPSGDAYFLFQRPDDRALLVGNAAHRGRLWTSRVWPGALLVDGAIVGTWRRAEAAVSIEPWRRLSPAERQAVEAEVASLPLPGMAGGMAAARWQSEQGTRNREQGTRNREQGTRNREQGTRNKEQGTGNREQGTRNREQGTGKER